MRFMMLVKIPTVAPEGEWQPSAEIVGEMSRYNEQLTKAGVLLALDGLTPPENTARLEFNASGTPTVTDGPYAEAKEVVGGYWIIQAKSRDEAIEWASRAPFREGVIEVRQIAEMSDFPPDVQEAAGELSQQPPHQAVER
jgi:hypothetical protein